MQSAKQSVASKTFVFVFNAIGGGAWLAAGVLRLDIGRADCSSTGNSSST
jgi:hypothetical protein